MEITEIIPKEINVKLVKKINENAPDFAEEFGLDYIGNLKKDKGEEVLEAIIGKFTDWLNLAEQFINIIPLYYDKARIWWKWDFKNIRWERVDEIDILNMVKNASYANIIKTENRTQIINALKQVAREKSPKEPKPSWLQFKDKIIDLETGEKFKATAEYFVTNPIPWSLGKSEDTPTMDRLFEEWVGKKYIKTLYEIIAYCMIRDYPINRLFCLIGGGLNGKSCYLNLLKKFIGEYNCCATELDSLLGSRFEVTRLHKKLVCQMGETNFNELSRTSILKKLTGGDLVGFEYKGKDHFEETNYAKIIIATNNLPATSDKTIGFYRRWLIIDFFNRFSEKKDILSEIPKVEYNNLALKSVGILIDLLKKREFENEGSIEERMERYESKSNHLETFLELFTMEDSNGYITKADFYKKLTQWCIENNHRKMSEKSVGMAMKKLHIQEARSRTFEWLNDGRGGQARTWEGLRWKEI